RAQVVQDECCERLQLATCANGQTDPRSRRLEPGEMLVEPEGSTFVDPQRLECRLPTEKRFVVGAHDGLLRIAEPAAGHGHGHERHARTAFSTGSSEPIASSSGRAFVHDSSTSVAGSESHTTPPPTQRWTRPPSSANVRIVSASSKSPF